ncbi:class I SAM-dependent methyltransferase [Lentisphaerota bacterium ZTH]|nr:class I SAM-dependent methyltransferase [Lentisphaerota bacterium]WET05909.1 class I SAM-dependent methyltransferase [Lentisphaerota bacterium ZTH]
MNCNDYYDQHNEDKRFELDVFKLEYYRTLDIIERFIPERKCVIYDIAGGTGHYFRYLIEQGHNVTMCDLSPRHVEIARNRYPEKKNRIFTGDARNLPELESNSADVVLNLGAMYHLPDPEDRLDANNESWRLLKPGGMLFNSYCIRNATAYVEGIQDDMYADPGFLLMFKAIRKKGTAPFDKIMQYFYFHTLDEIKKDLKASNFNGYFKIIGIESIGGAVKSFAEKLDNEAEKEKLFNFIRICEEDEALMGFNSHVMGISVKKIKS